MATFLPDLRWAVRLLGQTPGFTAIAGLTLALGIGANTAIFSVVDAVLLRAAPVEDLAGLVMVWETDRNSGTSREPASYPDYLDFAERAQSFDTLAAILARELNLTAGAGEPARVAALQVGHSFLPLLAVRPVVGRGFSPEEDRPGAPRVALISESLWERSFGRDRDIIGQTLGLDEVAHTIVGVVPDVTDFGVLQILSSAAYSRSFADRGGGGRVDVWKPLGPDGGSLPRSTHPLFVLGRLADGVTLAAAQQEMAALAAELERDHPENEGRGAHLEPLEEVIFGPVRPAMLVLLGAVALVLLVACVNVANLLLARGSSRRREVAVRSALGAGEARLARQFLVESLVLTLLSAGAGIGLALLGLDALVALAPPDVPRLEEVTIDLRVLAVTAGASILVGLVFGLVPTLQSRRLDIQAALRSEGGPQGSAGRTTSRLRSTLVVAELSLAVMLVVAAGLLLQSFWRLQRVDPGFRAGGVLKVEYQLPRSRYPVDFSRWPDFVEIHAFNAALRERAAALPGVSSAALAGNHPLDPGFTNSFVVVGREEEARGWPEISVRRVTPDYFGTVGLRLERGRALEERDGTAAPPVLLVNAAAAKRFFPGRDAIGERIGLWGASRTIVGVVADEKFQGLAGAAPLAVYLPLAQAPSANGAGVLLVRSPGDPRATIPVVRQLFRELDPALAVFGVEPLIETVSRSIAARRFTALLLGLFAAVALTLAAVGIYGVLSYAVGRRRREIGIRLALGASPREVLRSVVAHGLGLAALGAALGGAGALALGRLLEGLLFGVRPGDPMTFVGVALFVAAVALAASYAPARRAMRVDPVVTLRSE